MIRTVAAALLGALAAAVWLAFFYTSGGGLRVGFDVDPPRLVSGFHDAERDNTSGLTFAWTGAEAAIRLPGIDRRVPWTLTVRARNANAAAQSNPTLTFFVDGVQLHTQDAAAQFTDITVPVPTRPDRRGMTILIRSSATFVPGPQDRRELGIMVDSLRLSPDGLVLPPAGVFAQAMFAGAIVAAGIALLGVTPGSAIGAAVLLAAGEGAVLARGFAPYTDFGNIVVRLALATGVVLAVTAAVIRWRRRPLRNTARFAVAFTAGACFLELLVLLHPDMPVGDALFQAHRFQGVLRGNLYFTSIAPGGYAFPYAPGLYVAAAPFAGLVHREMGDVVLLRVVTTIADAIAGLLLYAMAARAWHDRLAAAFAVALYHLMPLSFRIVTVGNLTNAFAQSVSVGALAMMTMTSLRAAISAGAAVLAVVLATAFLSHTSTFALLSVSTVVIAGMFLVKGGPALRTPAKAVVLATAVAMVVAVAVYYAHFAETYRAEFARLGTETATAAPDAGGRGAIERAYAVPRYLDIYFGIPALLLAVVGAADRWRRGARDRLTLSVAGIVWACLLFLIVGILTPVDMRYYLAVIPALALLAAAGASWWWREGVLARLMATMLLAWAVWIGLETWWTTLP